MLLRFGRGSSDLERVQQSRSLRREKDEDDWCESKFYFKQKSRSEETEMTKKKKEQLHADEDRYIMVQITVKQELKENFDARKRSTEIWLVLLTWRSSHLIRYIFQNMVSRPEPDDKTHDTTPDLLPTLGSLRIGMRNIHWFASFGLPMYMHKMSNRAERRKQNWHTHTHTHIRPEKAFTDERERICDYCTLMSLIRERKKERMRQGCVLNGRNCWLSDALKFP